MSINFANATGGIYDNEFSNAKAIGQAFVSTASGTLTSATFSLWLHGTVTGDITAYIYAMSGVYGTSGVPTGDPLATSDTVAVSSLTYSKSSYTFTFSGANQIAITSEQNYVVVLRAPNASGYPNTVYISGSWKALDYTYGGDSAYSSSGGIAPWTVYWYSGDSYNCDFSIDGLPAGSASSSPSTSPSTSLSSSPSTSESSSISTSPSTSLSSSPSTSESSSISISVSSSPSASPSVLPEPPAMRDFTNKPGAVFNALKTTVIYAEDLANIKDWIEYLNSKI